MAALHIGGGSEGLWPRKIQRFHLKGDSDTEGVKQTETQFKNRSRLRSGE